MFELENEIPKHKKKSERTIKKSKHKHNYLPCYINFDIMNLRTTKIERKFLLSTYCDICGYIGDILFLSFENNQIQKKYNLSEDDLKNLPVFIIDSIFNNKYVCLSKGSEIK